MLWSAWGKLARIPLRARCNLEQQSGTSRERTPALRDGDTNAQQGRVRKAFACTRVAQTHLHIDPRWVGAHTLYGHTKHTQAVCPPSLNNNTGSHQATKVPLQPSITLAGVAWTSLPLCVWASDGDPKGSRTRKEVPILA